MRIENTYPATMENDNRTLFVLRNPTFKNLRYVLMEQAQAKVESRGKASYLLNHEQHHINPELAIEFLTSNGWSIPGHLLSQTR